MKIDTSSWKEYYIGDLFRFVKGKRLTKDNMIDGEINYLGAISENNGVRQRIQVESDLISLPNCITVNYNGSVGEAFYQHEPFWASDDVNILYAKGWSMNEYNALFIVSVIKANRYRFSYGRKWTLEKMKETIITLPSKQDGTPDFEYMEDYMKSLRHKKITTAIMDQPIKFSPQSWKEFYIHNLFNVTVSKDKNLQNSEFGLTPYISSSSENNGVSSYIESVPSQKGNTLTIARNGSVGSTFYQNKPYCASPDDIRILTPKFAMTKYSALFIKTVIEKEKHKYAYGRKLGTARIKNMVIKLPAAKDGTPDFDYMENYIKSLPYSDRI